MAAVRDISPAAKIALLVVTVVLAVAMVWWAIGKGQRTEAYYAARCPHGHIVVHGFGYCLDEDKNPYILRD